MSQPQTIKQYLAALNASLEVGLRSRRRILAEVEDHLRQASDEQLQRGIGPREAQRRAVLAFGPAEQVAARFDAGVIGALDRRLALSVRWIHQWVTQRRWGIPAFAMAVSILFAAALGAVAAAFGRDPRPAALACLGGGLGLVSFFIVSRRFRRELRDLGNRTDGSTLLFLWLVHPAGFSCLSLLVGDYVTTPTGIAGVLLVIAAWTASSSVIECAVERAARHYVRPTEQGRRQAWGEDHPWRAAVAAVAPLPLGLVMLIAVFPAPAPAALRVGLVAVVGLITALMAGAVRLEAARRERDAYQRVYMNE